MNQEILKAAEQIVSEVKEKLAKDPFFAEDQKIGKLFESCYMNTLKTTVKEAPDGTTYVITGDINAMWLRDSAAQLRPYLIQAKNDKATAQLIAGLVRRQMQCIEIDAYANAFNEEANGACWAKDETEQNPWVWERKFEIDSLCYPVQLAYLLWKQTGETSQFDDVFLQSAKKILEVFETEQEHEERSVYSFYRANTLYQDTLSRGGKGAHVKSGVGLIWSGFRPSDDACSYGYLIPSNMFASVILGYLSEIAETFYQDQELSRRAKDLGAEVFEAVEREAITKTDEFGDIYAYEVDGYGQYRLMDDANIPSLLSMNYLGYHGKDTKVAENTRRFLLSEANPYYFRGEKARGIGSAHTPSGYIWHLAIAMQGLTSDSQEEKARMLRQMEDTDAGVYMMHEGFHMDHPEQYTREWFSWANALFSELLLTYLGYEIKK